VNLNFPDGHLGSVDSATSGVVIIMYLPNADDFEYLPLFRRSTAAATAGRQPGAAYQ